MLGSNHDFFDPNVWYNEDELRKQVESFARCIKKLTLFGHFKPSNRETHWRITRKLICFCGLYSIFVSHKFILLPKALLFAQFPPCPHPDLMPQVDSTQQPQRQHQQQQDQQQVII